MHCSTTKGLQQGSRANSPKVTAAQPSPERQPSNLSQQQPHGGGGTPQSQTYAPPPATPPQEAADEVEEGEPTEEDVARAFAMYDTDGVGEIPALQLDGGCLARTGRGNARVCDTRRGWSGETGTGGLAGML